MSKRTEGRRKVRSVGCAVVALAPCLIILALFLTWSEHNRPPKIDLPRTVLPAVNAADDFHRAYLLSLQMKHKSPLDFPTQRMLAATDTDFAACATDAVPVIAAIRLGLTHPFVAPPGGMAANPGRYAEYREVARILAGAAEHYRRAGKRGEAVRILLDGMQMGAKIPKGDALIAFLVALAVDAICMSQIERYISWLTADELKNAADQLDRIAADRVPFSEIALNEGYESTRMWIAAFKDPKAAKNPLLPSFYEANKFLVDPGAGFNMQEPPPLNVKQRITLLKYGFADKERMLRENLAYYKAFAKECETQPYTAKSRTPMPDNLLIREMGTSDLARRMHTANEAVLTVLRLEIAVARYRKLHKVLPPTLAALTPDFLRSLPNDPFAGSRGKPPVYHPAADGASYKLYSLGPDMTDSGGAPMSYYTQDVPGDIVAGWLFPKKHATQ